MKTPAEILARSENGLPQQSWTSKTPTGDDNARELSVEVKTFVNMIFARFMAIYGHKFKSCFETQDEIRIAKREWALSLGGYTENELVAAIDYCKENSAWMPTISEFIKVLRNLTGDFGLPIAKHAYEEACNFSESASHHEWTHPAVYHAGKATGWFRLRTEDAVDVYPDFRYNYDVICRRIRSGERLDNPVPVALPDKSDDSLFSFIQSWGAEHQLKPEVASKWLFYLTKPKGSKVRERFKALAQVDANAMGITLPDDYQS
ncbi:replication protein P [Neptuniibacter pectenicola]|uniref:replication protein P n=1 Tax=Neptuniibacter pectenicola TaxID=1806669 RepID=UPI0009EE2DDA|nr:replication protein P [Neptuniibacter pectenicola]